ncbi:MAG: type II toxin-antitoxin system HicB family antitoxin [Chloroflexota bacterium]
MAETRHFNILLEWDPEGQVWVSYVPDLNFLSTFGDSREEAIANTREAILGYLEAARKEGLPIPHASQKAELVELDLATA